MSLIARWRAYMGPKDERLEAESNQAVKVGYFILLFGTVICLYYGIMLDQVASTTDHALLTPLGHSVFPLKAALLVVILVSCMTVNFMQMRKGILGDRARFAQVNRIPWDYVALVALVCGCVLGVTTTLMRILAEIQIVGITEVTWAGDIAMGIVYFILGFLLGILVLASVFRSVITRRQEIERELED